MATDPKEDAARAEVERLKAEYGEDVILRFAKKQRKARGKIGRPLLADEVALTRMADDIYLKPTIQETRVARRLVDSVDGPSDYAKIHRLCRKFRKDRTALLAEAEERKNPKPKPSKVEANAIPPPSIASPLQESLERERVRLYESFNREQQKTAEAAANALGRYASEQSASYLASVAADIDRQAREFIRRDQERLEELVRKHYRLLGLI